MQVASKPTEDDLCEMFRELLAGGLVERQDLIDCGHTTTASRLMLSHPSNPISSKSLFSETRSAACSKQVHKKRSLEADDAVEDRADVKQLSAIVEASSITLPVNKNSAAAWGSDYEELLLKRFRETAAVDDGGAYDQDSDDDILDY